MASRLVASCHHTVHVLIGIYEPLSLHSKVLSSILYFLSISVASCAPQFVSFSSLGFGAFSLSRSRNYHSNLFQLTKRVSSFEEKSDKTNESLRLVKRGHKI